MYSPEKIFSLLDLTSLNDNDTPDVVAQLCAKAVRPDLGQVAAVCVYAQFVAQARALLPENIAVATVVNFPSGEEDLADVAEQTVAAIVAGAAEIDLVFPYQGWKNGSHRHAERFTESIADECHQRGALLKVILETGELTPEEIRTASEAAIRVGADFLKTSTGKTAVGATPEAAAIMLQAIADSGRPVGLKLSGGVREVAAAQAFMKQAAEVFGEDYLRAQTFRIGASALADKLSS